MITVDKAKTSIVNGVDGNETQFERQYKCLSTDTKPETAAVNSLCLELDTGKFYYFDGTDWGEVPSTGGGGGGDSSKFTTATVTFIMSNFEEGRIGGFYEFPNITENDEFVTNMNTDTETAAATAVLYNGKCYLHGDSPGTNILSVSGDAELEYGQVTLTGDCTITYNGDWA